jgi:DNA-binding CsgD family transcriptional regulator
MSIDEDLSRLIGRIYEAAFEPDAWKQVITELMTRTGSRVAFVSSVDLRHGEFNRTFFYAPEESRVDMGVREYAEETYMMDPALAWATEHPSAGMCETEAILAGADYLDHPFIKWQRDRLGTTHFRVMYTQPLDDMSFALSLHPPANEGPPSKELRPLHRLLFGHMERAVRLAARPPDFSRDTGAVVALDRYGRVVARSPRADELFAKSDGLEIRNQRLVATHRESTALLDLTIRSAIDAQITGGAGGGVRITRNSGRPHWLALTSPYPRFLEHLPIPTPSVVVRILETEAHLSLSEKHADLFRLTHREIEIGTALLEGHSIDSLAARLGMSRNTARVHLQSLFRKTETNRQSDLIRVLTKIALH